MNSTAERFVAEIMTCNVVSVVAEDDLADAVRIMEEERLSVLPVIDQSGKACGILSTSDLISKFHNMQTDMAALPHVSESVRPYLIEALTQEGGSRTVGEVMTKHVKFVTPQEKLGEAARVLIDHSIHHLPVVNENGTLVGILSTTDIVRSVAYVA